MTFDEMAFDWLCRSNPEIAAMADPKAFYKWMHERTKETAQAIVAAEAGEKAAGRPV